MLKHSEKIRTQFNNFLLNILIPQPGVSSLHASLSSSRMKQTPVLCSIPVTNPIALILSKMESLVQNFQKLGTSFLDKLNRNW